MSKEQEVRIQTTDSGFELHSLEGYIETLHLAVYPEKILVLDSGCSCDVGRVIRYVVHGLGRSVDSIKLVVASHAHPDHMGGASRFREENGVEVAALPLINSWYKGIGGSIQHKVDSYLAQYVAIARRQRLKSLRFERHLVFDHSLEDDGPVPYFEDWISIHIPGHTDHDVALYNESAAMLYVADAIINLNHHFMLPLPVTLVRQLRASFAKLKELEIKTLVLAHRGVHSVEDMGSIVDPLQEQLDQGIPGKPQVRFALAMQSFSPALRRARKQNR
jgi:glyoxylase-like metal-dependent hydrolase (beta-lactamase superfamily II)